jgi:hypothetical protein
MSPGLRKEALMNSSSTKFDGARKALLWIGVVVLALFPFPWWW